MTDIQSLACGQVTENIFNSLATIAKRESQSFHYRHSLTAPLELLESDFMDYAIRASICYAKKPVEGVSVQAHVCQRLRFDGARIAYGKKPIDRRTVDYKLVFISDKKDSTCDHDTREAIERTLSDWRDSRGRQLITKMLTTLSSNRASKNVGELGKTLGLSIKESYDTWNCFKQNLKHNLGQSDNK